MAVSLPATGTTARSIYDVVAARAGERVKTTEVAAQLDLQVRPTSAALCQLRRQGRIKGTKPGPNGTAEYWVEP